MDNIDELDGDAGEGGRRIRNREEAGRMLAAELGRYSDQAPVVLGLPRGGVPVAYEVALALGAPLDVWVVRKVGVPWHQEPGVGAVAEGNYVYISREIVTAVGLSRDQLSETVAAKKADGDRHGNRDLCVHRKGATRAFGPGRPEVPSAYRAVGQPVLIPGSMGTASFVLAGTEIADEISFGSSCHGAGRAMSRTAAKDRVAGHELRQQLESRGIVVRCPSNAELAEEAPIAYKDVERVVAIVHAVGIARKVARLRPIGVVKG